MAQINFGTGPQGAPPTEEQKNLIRAALDLFSTADHDKLDAIEAGADVTDTENVVASLTAGDNITIASDGTISSTDTTLSDEQVQDIIGAMVTGNTESGITVTYDDATGSIVFSVESQTDENFTTADHAKLDGIESGATADQTDAEIKTAYENNADTNAFTDADHTKLDGIESGADVTPAWVPDADPTYATESYVDTEVSNLVDSAPGTLDTLNELADALGDDPNFATTVTNSIAAKLPLAGGTMSGDITMGANAINFDDGATIDVGGGTGTLTVDGNFTNTGLTHLDGLKLEGSSSQAVPSGNHGFISASSGGDISLYVRGNNKFTAGNTANVHRQQVMYGGFNWNAMTFPSSTSVSWATSLDLNGDLDVSGDINLSDGATIDVGSGAGDLTIDGDLTMTGTINVPSTPGAWLNNTYFHSRIDGGAFYFRGAGGAKRFLFENCDLLAFAHNNSFGVDTGFSATAAGEVSLGNGTRGDASGTLKLADIDASGDISVTGTVDGRDIATDGTKLDGIEVGADVTDTDNVVAALTAGTNITIAGDGTISSTDTSLSSEEVQDLVGGMVSSNTESGISVTYDDTDGTLDFSVDSQTDENFTTADHAKLDGIAAGADVTPAWVPSSDPSYATESYVDTELSNLVDSAPGALDTLNELAAALGDDPNFATTVTNSIADKLPLAGGTMSGDITMGANNIIGSATNSEISFLADRTRINSGTGRIDFFPSGAVTGYSTQALTWGGSIDLAGDLDVDGDINLSSSNVFSVNGAGRVQLTDLGGTMVEFSNAYFTGFNGGIRLGATAGDITTDVQIVRNSASEIRFVQSDSTTRCDLLADNLTLDGDINLSDGSTIDIGGGTGEATISGDLDISGGSSTLKTGYGQSGLKAFSGLSGTITPSGGVAMGFVNYYDQVGAYFATNNSGLFRIYSNTLNAEAGFSGNSWAATGFEATSPGATFNPAFKLDATSGDEGGFYLSGTDQVWCSDRTDRVKLKLTGELEVLSDLDVTGDISLSGHASLGTTLTNLDTASTTNASNLSTHTSDTSIHYADAPSDGSQYARQNGAWSVVSGGGASSGDATDITGLLRGNGSTLSAASASQIRSDAGLDTTDSPTFAGLAIENTTTADSLLLTTTEDSSDAAPVLTFKRNSSTISSGDYLGQLKFKGENDADQEVVYAKITGKINDETDGSEDGLIEFMLSKNGANNIGARLTSTDLKLINGTGLEVDGDISLTDGVGASIISTGTLTLGGDSKTIEISGGFGGMKLDANDQFTFQKLGSTEFIIGGSAGHQSNRGIFPSGGAHDIGLTGSRWGTAYLTDIDASGDISLSDGAEINIGSTAGTADILGQVTITTDGLYDNALNVNSGNITLRNDGAMGCKSLTISNLKNYVHATGPRVCNANVIGFVDHTTNAVSYSANAAFSYGNPTNNNDRNGGAVIALGNGTAQDASGTLQLADIVASGNIDFSGLPTSDPAVAGRLWNDSGTLKISAG